MLHTSLEIISRFDLNTAVELLLNKRYLGITLPIKPKSKQTQKKSARNQQIIERHKAGETLGELALEFGISEQRVHQIVRGKRK
ncbi:MAG: hypothetical protein Phog2KO_16470 [Phototrophicaceae bacterium]